MQGLAFLETYASSSTRASYRVGIRAFLETAYGRELKTVDLQEVAVKYLQEERDRQDDVQKFLAAINGRPGKTVRLYLTAVKAFLAENEIELPQLFWKRIGRKVKGNRALTLDKVPSNAQLKQILSHMPIHGRALYLTLSSSGTRIGETLQLKLGDVDLDSEPAKLSIRGEHTKSGNSRIAFISSETKETLLEWLKVRKSYIETAVAKSTQFEKQGDDQRLFPFQDTTAYSMWKTAVEKAGFAERDASTHRQTRHPHVLRKFFRTRLGAVIPVDIVEALMGHEGYLTEVYRRYSPEDLADFYSKGVHALTVFTNGGPSPEQIQKVVDEKVDDKIAVLSKVVTGQAAENLELKARLARLDLESAELKSRLQERESGIQELADVVVRLDRELAEVRRHVMEVESEAQIPDIAASREFWKKVMERQKQKKTAKS